MKMENHKKTFPVNWTTLTKIHPQPVGGPWTFSLNKKII